MRITYDAVADAAYVYLVESIQEPETVTHDYNVMLDFMAGERLVGIEVLDASVRLDLKYLRPHIDKIDGPVFRWPHFIRKVSRFLDLETPIEGTDWHEKAWVEEIGPDRVRIRLDQSGEVYEVSREQLEDLDITPFKAVRKLGILGALYEMGRPPWPAKPYAATVC